MGRNLSPEEQNGADIDMSEERGPWIHGKRLDSVLEAGAIKGLR